jgi:hypothetical protein
LLVSCIEIFLFTFVFPSQTAALPNVRETALALGGRLFCYTVRLRKREELFVFDDTLLEAKRLAAGWIGGRWCCLTEQRAKVIEVLLICGRFLPGISRPLSFEFCGRHCNKLTKLFPHEKFLYASRWRAPTAPRRSSISKEGVWITSQVVFQNPANAQ